MPSSRRVAVVGTGAMAMLFGARLARAGHQVTLWGSWADGLRAIRRHGVRVESEAGSWSARLSARRLGEGAVTPPASLVLVLVKSHQSRDVGGALGSLVAEEGTVLTLQNGLGNRERLELESARPVALGLTTAAAAVTGPGRVREVSTGRTVLGVELEEVARLLGRAGFDTATSGDIRPWVWLKLAVNCAINPLTAIEGLRNGELLERPGPRRRLIAAASEVAAVAAGLGFGLPTDPAEETLRVARATAGNVSSMLQDLRRGVPTEIDVLCGAVVRRARRAGVAVPVNEELWRRITELESAAPARSPLEVGA